MENEKLREGIYGNGFYIMKNYITNFNKTINFIKKKIKKQENDLFNWKGLNGNNVYVRNVNRQAYDLYNIATIQYIHFYKNNNKKELDKMELYNYYDFSHLIKCLKEDEEKTIKVYMFMTKNFDFFKYIFKDLLKKMDKVFNTKYVLVSVKLHRLYPGALEQEIHRDGKKMHQKDRTPRLLILMVPLHNTIKELSTIFYPFKEYVNFLDYSCLFENLSNNLKKKFTESRFQSELSIGDVVVQNGWVYHHGPKNNTNTIREFLFLELHQLSSIKNELQ